MGLSISRQIIEKHGALMELDSAPGEGTTFRLVFPVGTNPLLSVPDQPPEPSSETVQSLVTKKKIKKK